MLRCLRTKAHSIRHGNVAGSRTHLRPEIRLVHLNPSSTNVRLSSRWSRDRRSDQLYILSLFRFPILMCRYNPSISHLLKKTFPRRYNPRPNRSMDRTIPFNLLLSLNHLGSSRSSSILQWKVYMAIYGVHTWCHSPTGGVLGT
jgi:hypothetical protein